MVNRKLVLTILPDLNKFTELEVYIYISLVEAILLAYAHATLTYWSGFPSPFTYNALIVLNPCAFA